MQLPLAHSPSLLSVGAKSHVSTASGCVDSFTNRNVKRHPQGGLGDKGGAARGRKRSRHDSKSPVKTPPPAQFKSTPSPALLTYATSGVKVMQNGCWSNVSLKFTLVENTIKCQK